MRHSSIGLIQEKAAIARRVDCDHYDKDTNDSGCWSAAETPESAEAIPKPPKPVFTIRYSARPSDSTDSSSELFPTLFEKSELQAEEATNDESKNSSGLPLTDSTESTATLMNDDETGETDSIHSSGASSELISTTPFEKTELQAEESTNEESKNSPDPPDPPLSDSTDLTATPSTPSYKTLVRILSDVDFDKCGWLKEQDQDNGRAMIYLPFENRIATVENQQF